MRERLYLFDTTLRDGQQTQGVQFSTVEKRVIAAALDALGVDYIEGGWPGANPTDSEFFAARVPTRAVMTAFGMTKRVGRSAENDDVLAAVLDAGTPAVCLVGKTHEFHVLVALSWMVPVKPSGRPRACVSQRIMTCSSSVTAGEVCQSMPCAAMALASCSASMEAGEALAGK